MVLVCSLGSVVNAEDENSNENNDNNDSNHNNSDHGSIHTTGRGLGGDRNISRHRAHSVVDSNHNGRLIEVGSGNTTEGTSFLVEGDAGNSLRHIEMVLGSNDERSRNGVGLAGLKDVRLGAVANGLGGNEGAVSLRLGTEHTRGTSSSLITLITNLAVLVAVAVVGSTREAVGSRAGQRNDGGVQSDLRQLNILVGAVGEGLEGRIVALGDGHTVSVVGSGVVEVVGEGLLEFGEVLLVGVVQDVPGLAVVGSLEDPAGRMSLVAVVGVRDGVVVDGLASHVLVGPLEPGTDADVAVVELGLDGVIEQLVDTLRAGLLHHGRVGTLGNSVLTVGHGAHQSLKLVGSRNVVHLVDLDGNDVLTRNEVDALTADDSAHHDVVGVLVGSKGVVSDARAGKVHTADLLAIEVNNHTSVGSGANLQTSHVGGGTAEVELESVVLSGALGRREGLRDGGGPVVVVEAQVHPVVAGEAVLEVLPVVTGAVDNSTNVVLENLGGLARTNGTRTHQGAVLESDLVASVTPAIVGGVGEGEGVGAGGNAEAVVHGSPLDSNALLTNERATSVLDLPAGFVGTARTEGQGEGEQGVGASADLHSDENVGRDLLTLDGGGSDGVLCAREDLRGHTVDVTVGAIHGQGGGKRRSDLEVAVVRRGALERSGGDTSVGLVVGGGEGEGGNGDGVDVLLVELDLSDGVTVGGLDDGVSLGGETNGLVSSGHGGDVEALSLDTSLPRDVHLSGHVVQDVSRANALNGPVGDIVVGSIPAGDDAVLVDELGLVVREGDLQVSGGLGVVVGTEVTGVVATIEGLGGSTVAFAVGSDGGALEIQRNSAAGSEVEQTVKVDLNGASVEVEQAYSESDRGRDGGNGARHGSPDGLGVTSSRTSRAGNGAVRKVVAVDLHTIDVDDDAGLGLEVEGPGLVGGEGEGGAEALSEQEDSLGGLDGRVVGEGLPGGIRVGSRVPVSGNAASQVLPVVLGGELEASVDAELLVSTGEEVEVGNTDGSTNGELVGDVEEVALSPAAVVLTGESDSPDASGETEVESRRSAVSSTDAGVEDGVVGVVDGPGLVGGDARVGLLDDDGGLGGLVAADDSDGNNKGISVTEEIDGTDSVGLAVDAGLEGTRDDTGRGVQGDARGKRRANAIVAVTRGDGGEGNINEGRGVDGVGLVLETSDDGEVVGDHTELSDLEHAVAKVVGDDPLEARVHLVVGTKRVVVSSASSGESLSSGLLVQKSPSDAIVGGQEGPVLGITAR